MVAESDGNLKTEPNRSERSEAFNPEKMTTSFLSEPCCTQIICVVVVMVGGDLLQLKGDNVQIESDPN